MDKTSQKLKGQNKKYERVSFRVQQSQEINTKQLIAELKRKSFIPRHLLLNILQNVGHNLEKQPNLITLQSPVVVIGDIHGQFYDLLSIFQKFENPEKSQYLFLGDYVDRGMFCIEVMTLLLIYKLKYPKNIHLLRGNHQCRMLTSTFNFKEQCIKKYDVFIYQVFMQFFDLLPLCAVIDSKFFCVHAGISPDFNYIAQIQKLNRFMEIPQKGIICDLLWSDPSDEQTPTWQANKMRSCSYFYSSMQSSKFLQLNKVKLIIRGHEVQMKGYKYQCVKENYKNEKKTLALTVFSAPNYCDSYKNDGAAIIITKDELKIQIFKNTHHPLVLANYMNVLQWSLPFVASSVGKILVAILKNRTHKKTLMVNHQQLKQKIKALQKIDLFNSLLSTKVEQNQNLLNDSISQPFIQQSIQTAMALFIKKKSQDNNQRRPQIFGPKLYRNRRIKISVDDQFPNNEN